MKSIGRRQRAIGGERQEVATRPDLKYMFESSRSGRATREKGGAIGNCPAIPATHSRKGRNRRIDPGNGRPIWGQKHPDGKHPCI